LPASIDQLAHQHIYSIFSLARPTNDGRDQGPAIPAHCWRHQFTVGFSVAENGAQIGIVEIGKIFRE